MIGAFKLLLPALMPSWRFFKTVDPSPRVQWVLLEHASATSDTWQEFRPRPQRVTLGDMLWRMLWNARWNEGLFLVSCAERLTLAPTEDPTDLTATHSRTEILRRIARELARTPPPAPPGPAKPYLQFRILFIDRDETGEVYQAETYQSEPVLLAELDVT